MFSLFVNITQMTTQSDLLNFTREHNLYFRWSSNFICIADK